MAYYNSIMRMSDTKIQSLLDDNKLYNRDNESFYKYGRFSRFGLLGAYDQLENAKEYLFFTKPNLHLYDNGALNSELSSEPYFVEMDKNYPYVMQSLQSSYGSTSYLQNNPFIPILTNMVNSSLDIGSLTANEMDTPQTIYGTSMTYRKDSWSGDEDVSFSLEFKDTKYLEVYRLINTYDKYERLKSVGLITPPDDNYRKQHCLHDVMGIYKFIVDADYEEIIYWAYICGAYFNSVPRDVINGLGGDNNHGSISFAVDFKAFCVDDLDPQILSDFNTLAFSCSKNFENKKTLDIYNDDTGRVDGSFALMPYIARVTKSNAGSAWRGSAGMSYKYKLKWKAV